MKIKNLIIALSAIGSMFTASLFAQTSENKLTAKNEVSISVDDVFAKNRNNNVWNVNGFETQFATMLASPKMGLGCKYHFQTSAMRTKISYAYNSSNFNDQDVKTNKTYSLGFIASIGYEIQKKYDNVQLFYGVDAVETVVDFNAKTQYETTSFDNQKIDYSSKSSGDYFSIGLSPFLGIKYFLTSHLSLSTEIHCNVSYFDSYSKTENTNEAQTVDNKTTNSGFISSLGPLGNLSLNIHF